jgi:hypothetical protein
MNKLILGLIFIGFVLMLMNAYDILFNSLSGLTRLDLLILSMTMFILSQVLTGFKKG